MKRYIAILLLTAVVLCNFFSCERSDTTPSSTEATEPSEPPTYSISLVETPEKSIWEFTYGAERSETGEIQIGSIQSDQGSSYPIYMLRRDSLIGPKFIYFLSIRIGYFYDRRIELKLNENNVDAIWELLNDIVADYNETVTLGNEYAEPIFSQYVEQRIDDWLANPPETTDSTEPI